MFQAKPTHTMFKAIVAALVATSFQGLLNTMACDLVKCRIRSFLLNSSVTTSSQSLLKVDLHNGSPTGVSVTGRNSDSSSTVFLLEHCRRPTGCTSQCKLVTRIHWEHNQSYMLAVNANQVTLEVFDQTATDRYDFSLKTIKRGCAKPGNPCVAFKPLLQRNAYITTDKQGQVAASPRTRKDRDTWFWLDSCYT